MLKPGLPGLVATPMVRCMGKMWSMYATPTAMGAL